MMRVMGIVYAAIAAIVIAMAPMSPAQAAPVFAGSGNIVRDAVPNVTENVRRGGFRGGGFRGHRGGFRGGWRGHRGYGHRRGYRAPIYGAPVYYGAPAYYGRRCFIRPARWVWTDYGRVLRPARRVCR
jgi:hypothetical protein